MHIATNGSRFDISAENNTANLANKFSTFLKRGDVVFLYGEIGVGKTTFVRHLINCFQKKKKLELTEVPSPTFNIVIEYHIKDLIIQHYDLFRLKDTEETKNIGLFENYEDVLTIVEWPEKINNRPKDLIELFFEYQDKLEKRFVFTKGLKAINLNEF